MLVTDQEALQREALFLWALQHYQDDDSDGLVLAAKRHRFAAAYADSVMEKLIEPIREGW